MNDDSRLPTLSPLTASPCSHSVLDRLGFSVKPDVLTLKKSHEQLKLADISYLSRTEAREWYLTVKLCLDILKQDRQYQKDLRVYPDVLISHLSPLNTTQGILQRMAHTLQESLAEPHKDTTVTKDYPELLPLESILESDQESLNISGVSTGERPVEPQPMKPGPSSDAQLEAKVEVQNEFPEPPPPLPEAAIPLLDHPTEGNSEKDRRHKSKRAGLDKFQRGSPDRSTGPIYTGPTTRTSEASHRRSSRIAPRSVGGTLGLVSALMCLVIVIGIILLLGTNVLTRKETRVLGKDGFYNNGPVYPEDPSEDWLGNPLNYTFDWDSSGADNLTDDYYDGTEPPPPMGMAQRRAMDAPRDFNPILTAILLNDTGAGEPQEKSLRITTETPPKESARMIPRSTMVRHYWTRNPVGEPHLQFTSPPEDIEDPPDFITQQGAANIHLLEFAITGTGDYDYRRQLRKDTKRPWMCLEAWRLYFMTKQREIMKAFGNPPLIMAPPRTCAPDILQYGYRDFGARCVNLLKEWQRNHSSNPRLYPHPPTEWACQTLHLPEEMSGTCIQQWIVWYTLYRPSDVQTEHLLPFPECDMEKHLHTACRKKSYDRHLDDYWVEAMNMAFPRDATRPSDSFEEQQWRKWNASLAIKIIKSCVHTSHYRPLYIQSPNAQVPDEEWNNMAEKWWTGLKDHVDNVPCNVQWYRFFLGRFTGDPLNFYSKYAENNVVPLCGDVDELYIFRGDLRCSYEWKVWMNKYEEEVTRLKYTSVRYIPVQTPECTPEKAYRPEKTSSWKYYLLERHVTGIRQVPNLVPKPNDAVAQEDLASLTNIKECRKKWQEYQEKHQRVTETTHRFTFMGATIYLPHKKYNFSSEPPCGPANIAQQPEPVVLDEIKVETEFQALPPWKDAEMDCEEVTSRWWQRSIQDDAPSGAVSCADTGMLTFFMFHGKMLALMRQHFDRHCVYQWKSWLVHNHGRRKEDMTPPPGCAEKSKIGRLLPNDSPLLQQDLPASDPPRLPEDNYGALPSIQNIGTYHAGLSQPVLFEPRPTLRASAGTFTLMILIDLGDIRKDFVAATEANDAVQAAWAHKYSSQTPHQVSRLTYDQELSRFAHRRSLIFHDQLTEILEEFEGIMETARVDWDAPARSHDISYDPYTRKIPQRSQPRNDPQRIAAIEKAERILEEMETMFPSPTTPWPNRKKRFIGLLWNFGNSMAIASVSKRVSRINKKLKVLAANDELLNSKIKEVAGVLDKTIVATHTLARDLKGLTDRVKVLTKVLKDYIELTNQNIRALYASAAMSEQVSVLNDAVQDARRTLQLLEKFLATHVTKRFTPEIITPAEMKEYVEKMREELLRYPKLKLPVPKESDVWPYYPLMRVNPILCKDFLVLIVEVPLESTDLQMNLYRVHNLPALSVAHKLAINYLIEGPYFAVSQDHQYVSVPDATSVEHCEATGHTVCHYRAPMYPKHKCQFCLCALYDDILEDQTERIMQTCPVRMTNSTKHRAIYLEDNFWAIVTARDFQLQIVCRQKTTYQRIKAPLGFVNLTGGCLATGSELFLPSMTQVTTIMDSVNRQTFVSRFSSLAKSYDELKIWNYLNFSTKSLDEIQEFKTSILPDLPERMPMGLINKKLGDIGKFNDPPWYKEMIWWILIFLVLTAVVVAILLYFVWCKGHLGKLELLTRLFRKKDHPLGDIIEATLKDSDGFTQVERKRSFPSTSNREQETDLDIPIRKRDRTGSLKSYASMGHDLDPSPAEAAASLTRPSSPISLRMPYGPNTIPLQREIPGFATPPRDSVFEPTPVPAMPPLGYGSRKYATTSPELGPNLQKYSRYVKSKLPE